MGLGLEPLSTQGGTVGAYQRSRWNGWPLSAVVAEKCRSTICVPSGGSVSIGQEIELSAGLLHSRLSTDRYTSIKRILRQYCLEIKVMHLCLRVLARSSRKKALYERVLKSVTDWVTEEEFQMGSNPSSYALRSFKPKEPNWMRNKKKEEHLAVPCRVIPRARGGGISISASTCLFGFLPQAIRRCGWPASV